MRLPNVGNVRIEREKVVDYLLNPSHPYGRSKAAFFIQFGFFAEHWQLLADALREHAATHPVAEITETPFGPRFTVEGVVKSPDGRNPAIRSVWQLDDGDDDGELAPRLITAYPLEQ